ncbi:MAG: hypothetical protein R3C32_11640 [Chloroflexota bacterium]
MTRWLIGTVPLMVAAVALTVARAVGVLFAVLVGIDTVVSPGSTRSEGRAPHERPCSGSAS